MNNITINSKLKQVEISLNHNFYSIDIVKKAIEDFKELGKFNISENKTILVSIQLDNKESIDTLGYELCNYVLALMKNEDVV